MERKFEIVMHAPLGKRRGTISFTECNGRIEGALVLFGNSEPFEGKIADEGTIEFSGKLATKLYTFSYKAEGTVSGNKLSLLVTGGRHCFEITGEETDEREEKSNELY